MAKEIECEQFSWGQGLHCLIKQMTTIKRGANLAPLLFLFGLINLTRYSMEF